MPGRFMGSVSVPEGVLVRELDGEAVILDANEASYYGLNEVGTRMWHALTKTASFEAAFDLLVSEYDVEPQRLRRDLAALVDQLHERGLLRIKFKELS